MSVFPASPSLLFRLTLAALVALGVGEMSPAFAQSLRFVPPIYNVSAATGTNSGNPLLFKPSGVVVDLEGNLFIADTGNKVVRKVSPTQTATIYAGAGGYGYTGDGGSAVSATLKAPTSLAVDSAGNVYVSDPESYAVRKISTAGIITTVVGGNGAGSTGDGGLATAAQITPGGIAADVVGNLYVVDATSATVRVVSTAGIINTYAGGGMLSGSAADNGPATAAKFINLTSVALDTSGNLYIADAGSAIVRKVDSLGTITTFAGNGISGFSGDGGLATSAQLRYPQGLSVDPSGNLYIGDVGAANVRVVNTANIISTVVGIGSTGVVLDGTAADHARIDSPRGVATDNYGNLYIAVPATDSVYQVALHTERFPETKVGSSSQPQRLILENLGGSTINLSSFTLSGDFALYPALLPQPTPCTQTDAISGSSSFSNYCTFDVVFTPTTEGIRSFPLTINSNDAPATLVQTLSSTGLGSALAMTSGEMYIVAGKFGTNSGPTASGPATSIGLTTPSGVVVDSAGNIYFSEEPFCQVEKVDGKTGILSTFGGTHCLAPNETISGDGGPAAAAVIPGAGALALDSKNNLYIADGFDARIRQITTDGKIHTFAGEGVGIGNSPFCGYSADGVQASLAQLCGPDSMAFDGLGNLYFSETNNTLIRKISTAGVLSTVAGNYALGAGFSGDGGQATAAKLNQPRGLVVNAAGDVIFSDTYNHVIRKVSASTGQIATIAGKHGVPDYSGDGGLATAATFQYPMGLTIDAAGDLFVADYQNWVIRKIDTAGLITTVAGNHLSEFFNGDGLAATASGLSFPNYVFVSPGGLLFISDQDHELIREVSPNGSLLFPPQKVGTTSAPQSVTISNIGNLPMQFDAQTPTAVTGDFALSSGGNCDFTATLAVGASCNVNLTFTPTAEGARFGIFGFFDNGIASPQLVSLQGTGAQPQPQRIRFNPIPNHIYGDADFSISADADSALPLTLKVVSGNATMLGTTVHITGVGPVVIAADQPGVAGAWLPAVEVKQSFSIAKAVLLVDAQSATSTRLVALSPLTYLITGFAYNETSIVLTGKPSLSTTATPSSVVGFYPINIAVGTLAAANYSFAFSNGQYYLAPYVVPSASVRLTVKTSIARGDNFGVTVTVTNNGTATAQNVVLTSLKLNAVHGSPASRAMGNIPAGGSAVTTFMVPFSAGASGHTVVEQIAGTYTGGTFGGTLYVSLP